MEFEQTELDAIEHACRVQAHSYRELAAKVDRPVQKNQRLDWATQLDGIAARIEQDRRQRAGLGGRCTKCDD
jgi:hypothetical protein